MVRQIYNGKGLGLEPWRALTESLVRLRVFRLRLGLNELANLAQKEGNVLKFERQTAKRDKGYSVCTSVAETRFIIAIPTVVFPLSLSPTRPTVLPVGITNETSVTALT
jgi:hypothetical protein